MFTAGTTLEAYAGITITMESDQATYDHSSVIIVTGHVDPVDPNGGALTIQVFAPNGNLAQVGQVSVYSDGDFSTTINTASLKKDGIYMIKAKYVNADATVLVELVSSEEMYSSETTDEPSSQTVISPDLNLDLGEAGPLQYDITCSTTDPHFLANGKNSTLEIYLDPAEDGVLTITLDEEIIKPFDNGDFFVFVDGEEIQNFVQDGNTLIIPCKVGDEKIEIVGSWAIPEFGTIAVMILVVAIVAIIAVSAKTKLSLVPRY